MAVFSVNNSNNRFTLKLTLTEGAYSVADNSSPVSYKLELIANTSYNFEKYAIGSQISIDGEQVHYQERTTQKQYSIADYGTLTLASGSKTITHDADGKKKIGVSFSIDMAKADYTPGALSQTGEMDLMPIPRQATITSAPNFTDEENPTMVYSNPAGNSVTSLKACISLDTSVDDIQYRDIPKTATSYTFPLTEDERNILRNATKTSNSRKVYFFIMTTIGETTYRTHIEKTLTIVNANPVFTASQVDYEDISGIKDITQNPLLIVQNESVLGITFTAATGKKGADILDYTLTLNGTTKTVEQSGQINWGAVNSSNNVTLYVKVRDSRGNETTVEKPISMVAYAPPIVNAVLERLNNYEETTFLTVNASVSSVNGKNDIQSITYEQSDMGGDYEPPIPVENKVPKTLYCNNEQAVVFRITVIDIIGGKATEEYTLDKGIFPWFVDVEKGSVGVDCFPQGQKTFEVSGHEFISSSMCWMGNADIDANKMTSQGVWLVSELPSSNYPLPNGNGVLVVIGQSFGITFQMFYTYTGDTWCRVLWYNNWSVWKQMTN